MIVLNFGLYGIRFRRGNLFGDMESHPIFSVRFLFFSAVILRDRAALDIRQSVIGLSENPAWLAENARSVRLERRKARAKARAQMEAEYREELDRTYSLSAEMQAKLDGACNQIYALRRVIKGLQESNHD